MAITAAAAHIFYNTSTTFHLHNITAITLGLHYTNCNCVQCCIDEFCILIYDIIIKAHISAYWYPGICMND